MEKNVLNIKKMVSGLTPCQKRVEKSGTLKNTIFPEVKNKGAGLLLLLMDDNHRRIRTDDNLLFLIEFLV